MAVVVVAFALENHGGEKTWRLAWKLTVAYFLMRHFLDYFFDGYGCWKKIKVLDQGAAVNLKPWQSKNSLLQLPLFDAKCGHDDAYLNWNSGFRISASL